MRYLGQNYGVEVLVPPVEGELDETSLTEIYRRFAARHQSLYGYDIPHEIVEFVHNLGQKFLFSTGEEFHQLMDAHAQGFFFPGHTGSGFFKQW